MVSKKKLSDDDYASLLMEIEILSQLDHPHIIRYALIANHVVRLLSTFFESSKNCFPFCFNFHYLPFVALVYSLWFATDCMRRSTKAQTFTL